MDAGEIVILVAAIVVPVLLVGIGLALWLRSRVRKSREQMAEELAVEPPIRGPEPAIYRGTTGSYSRVLGNGQIALTTRRLIFRKLVGSGVDVALADVTGVRTAKSFNKSVVGNRTHLVVETTKGDVAYFVTDLAGWQHAIDRATSPAG